MDTVFLDSVRFASAVVLQTGTATVCWIKLTKFPGLNETLGTPVSYGLLCFVGKTKRPWYTQGLINQQDKIKKKKWK